MDTQTLMICVALIAGLRSMPALNVFKICARGAGTLRVDPWRIRAGATVQKVSQTIRTWFSSLMTPRMVFACLAVLLAILASHLGAGHEVIGMAIAPALSALGKKRARLLREATALKNTDGTFADDAKRQAFDAKMAEIEALDGGNRSEQSDTLIERDPLDPGAPLGTTTQQQREVEEEPNERDLGVDAERLRVQGIINGCRAARMPQSYADKLIADGVTLLDAQTRILGEIGTRDLPGSGPRAGSGPAPQAYVGEDPLVHVRAGIENAILHRVQPHWFKLEDVGRQYRGMTLMDTARLYMQARGIRVTGMSKMEIAGTALGLNTRGGLHTTSDFANLLADVANKQLRRAYDEAPQTFAPLSRQTTAPDFKLMKRLQIGDGPALLAVDEHGEFTRGTIGEGKEQYQLATYGRIFGIDRKALVNDDTDAFSRVPMLFGRAARNLESNIVWSLILANAAMGDGVALFNAAHGNLSGTSDAIAVASIGAGRQAMRKQTGLDATTLINVAPAFLIVPPAKETLADQFVSTNLLASQSSSVNPFAGRLQVISEPRLEVGVGALSGSAVSWYLSASPDQIDVIEYAYLEGENGPVTESRIGFDVDGLEIKCRHDFAAKVLDWRGLFKNPGA